MEAVLAARGIDVKRIDRACASAAAEHQVDEAFWMPTMAAGICACGNGAHNRGP